VKQPKGSSIRDRIREFRRVRAGDLQHHPRNWRIHSADQRRVFRGLLAEVGYADALLVRELADGTLQIIDGHMRAETTPNALVPVLVLDVDESEAEKILLTHDPLAGMATTAGDQLESLLRTVTTENGAVQSLLDSLTAEPLGEELAADRVEVGIPESYQVVVECANEAEQQVVYERLRKGGYACRLLTL